MNLPYPSSPFHRLKYHHNWKFPLTKPKVRFNFQSNSSIDQHTTEKNWVSLTLRLTRFMLVLATGCGFGYFWPLIFCLFVFVFSAWQDQCIIITLYRYINRKGHIFLFLIENEIRMPNNESSRVIKRKIVVIVPVQCWHFKANTCALQCKATVAALRRLTPHG